MAQPNAKEPLRLEFVLALVALFAQLFVPHLLTEANKWDFTPLSPPALVCCLPILAYSITGVQHGCPSDRPEHDDIRGSKGGLGLVLYLFRKDTQVFPSCFAGFLDGSI